MQTKQILDVVPYADPAFIKVFSAIAVSAIFVKKVQEVLPTLHQLFLQKRNAFHRGAWQELHTAVEQEAELIRVAMNG